jgi:hypothetical protein
MPGLARVVNADDPVFPAYFEPENSGTGRWSIAC